MIYIVSLEGAERKDVSIVVDCSILQKINKKGIDFEWEPDTAGRFQMAPSLLLNSNVGNPKYNVVHLARHVVCDIRI